MRSTALYASGVCLLIGITTAGCAGPTGAAGTTVRRSAADFSGRTILDTTVDNVRPVAQRVFRDHFRIDEDASSQNVFVSRPTEVAGRGASPRIRDRIGVAPGRQRQLAEVRLRQEGDNVVVQASVITQRLDSVERASFARERGDDRPTETPIDRLGVTSPAPREEWTNIGRDRETEREILDAIQGSASGGPGVIVTTRNAP